MVQPRIVSIGNNDVAVMMACRVLNDGSVGVVVLVEVMVLVDVGNRMRSAMLHRRSCDPVQRERCREDPCDDEAQPARHRESLSDRCERLPETARALGPEGSTVGSLRADRLIELLCGSGRHLP